MLSLFSCVWLCDPMDCGLSGSSVHGFSRQEYWNTGVGCHALLKGSSQPRDQILLRLLHWEAVSSPRVPQGNPFKYLNSIQSLSSVRIFVTPWIAVRQASLSINNSQSSLRLTSIELVMPSSHLILSSPFPLHPIPPSIRGFSNESTLHMRWPKYWSFSFSISSSNEHSGLISFRWTGWIS